MRIKKTKRNEYIYASGLWIRNFAKKNSIAINDNRIISQDDRALLAQNEQANQRIGAANISDESIVFPKVVIISDGYNFEERHKIVSEFPNDVSVIAVNGTLKKWELIDKSNSDNFRTINVYLVNNPYAECMKYMPKKSSQYYPACVASARTYPNFLKQYEGAIYLYNPSPEPEFGFNRKSKYHIDDYRNPICSAIGLAYQFGAKKIMLMSCDDAFEDQREGAMQLENNLWMYPQQKIAENIIDANLFWLKRSSEDVEIASYSDGAKYVNAVYINSDEEAIRFFKDEEETQ